MTRLLVLATAIAGSWSGMAAAQEATRRVLPVSSAAAIRTAGAAAEGPVEIRLSARYSMAPAWMRSLIRVTPHEDNRSLRIELDSPSFSRGSEVQLEGARAAQNHFFSWQSLPPGRYVLAVIVRGSHGVRARRQLSFDVIDISSTSSAP